MSGYLRVFQTIDQEGRLPCYARGISNDYRKTLSQKKKKLKKLIKIRDEEDENYQEDLAGDGVREEGGFCIWVRNKARVLKDLAEDSCCSLNQSFPM